MTDLDLDTFNLSGLAVVDAPIADLRENPDNPRSIRESRLDDLAAALADDPTMLAARPLIALPDGTVIAGNMRLRVARRLGWTTIPTVFADLDPERARLWLLRDNNPYGEWEEQEVARMLRELELAEVDLGLTGFGKDDLDHLLATLDEPPDDRGLELALADVSVGDPKHETAKGETWELGRHVLVIANVYDGWEAWVPELESGDLLVPYPTPTLPMTARAGKTRLVMVQPDPWLAGHLLDKYAAVNGSEHVRRREQ